MALDLGTYVRTGGKTSPGDSRHLLESCDAVPPTRRLWLRANDRCHVARTRNNQGTHQAHCRIRFADRRLRCHFLLHRVSRDPLRGIHTTFFPLDYKRLERYKDDSQLRTISGGERLQLPEAIWRRKVGLDTRFFLPFR